MAGWYSYASLAHFALSDLIIQRGTGIQYSMRKSDQTRVVTDDVGGDFGGAFDLRRPKQLDFFARTDDRFNSSLLVGRQPFDGNGRRKFHIGFRLGDGEGKAAGERSGNREEQLAAGDIASEFDKQFQLQRGFTAARQQDSHGIAFSEELGIGGFAEELL